MTGRVPDPVGGAEARRAAREELSRPEYRHAGPGVLQRVLDWLGRHLSPHAPGGGSAVGGTALLVFGVLLLALIAVIVLRAGPPRRTPRRAADEDDPLAPVPARDHRRRADGYAAAGRHALAVREYLRAAVATIEERGVLPPRPGRTGAATAREAGPRLPAAADALRASTRDFDEVWFGGRAAGPDDTDRARAAADAVLRARVADDAAPPPGLAVPG